MKCSVFIATSLDGFIAKSDGSVEWLHSAGNTKVDMGKNADMGFSDYVSSVDCIGHGKKMYGCYFKHEFNTRTMALWQTQNYCFK